MSLTNSPAGATATLATALLFLLITCLGGCHQYRDRSDRISYGLGDAVRVNNATHTIDPWPKTADNPNLDINGERALVSDQRYRANETKSPKPLRAQSSAAKEN